MIARPNYIYITGRSIWYCVSAELFICITDAWECNEGYESKANNFVSPKNILDSCIDFKPLHKETNSDY